jgi:hypothetical protein
VSVDLQRAAARPALQEKLANLGSYARPMTSAETTAFIQSQQRIWEPVLADIGAREQQK